jgi:L-ribulokinase
MGLFAEFAKATGQHLSADELYKTLFNESTKGDPDCGGVLNFSNVSGENITNIQEGRPLFVRTPNSNFTLANFIKAQLYSAFAPLKIGMDILTKKEHIHMDAMIAQGGIFRTPKIAQQVLADALDIPITLMANAGEGGPWGMAVLALYGLNNADHESLADYLDHQVFAQPESTTLDPVAANVQGFDDYIAVYQKALPVAVAAGDDIQDYQPSKQVKE